MTLLENWWNNPDTQRWLVDRPIQIALILILAAIANWALRHVVKRVVRHMINTPPRLPALGPLRPGEKGEVSTPDPRREARIRTLGSVINSALSLFVWLWAIVAILDQIGVNVAPIIASAGVVGVALGFGAQSLVKDFLSGIFMLIEDQYGVGDTIDVGELSGTVEDVSLRLTTLRDIDGTLWFVRNGEILRIGNFSQGYAIARVDVPIAMDNDIKVAKDAILAAATAVANDDDIKAEILEPPILDGVNSVKVDHMTIRVHMKTKPGKQWYVQREMLARVIPSLSKAGIKPPYAYRRPFNDSESDS
ncbi:putative MscS family protein YkuT [Corynebacterium kalinowskii]|uniref:MscS family protein YkuT n=1 Tax=Corynebacterium kalinowskii TaxID=2675216 RepID=A0A6B8VPH2_9CORY|nr:mechanosensitive ion channel family protein [Corynebacterium kalinowskii]QGU01457.1 putative MscS family protein YkuT [Corynebacterium kalinowskii]